MDVFDEIFHGRFQNIQPFLESGGDPQIRDRRRHTLLHVVALHGHDIEISYLSDIIKMLLDYGVDPSITDNNDYTVLDFIPLDYDLIKLFLRYNYPINYQNRRESTLLHRVIRHPNLVKLILNYGGNPSIKDKYGKIPIDYAREFNVVNTINILEQHYIPTLTKRAIYFVGNYFQK